MQIIVESLEKNKPKLLDSSPLWLLNYPIKKLLQDYCQNIPSHYATILRHLTTRYALNDSFTFTHQHVKFFKEDFPFYKKFCYSHQFSFADYELSKTEDVYLEWYKDTLLDEATLNTHYFHDILMERHHLHQINTLYQGFISSLKEMYSQELQDYLRVQRFLKSETQWLLNSQLRVLRRYSMCLGLCKVENKTTDARAKVENFIPAGMCYYDKYIFINTYHYAPPHWAFISKTQTRSIFAHELGHALEDDLSIWKNPLKKSSYPADFSRIVKRTWKNFPSHKLTYFQKKYIKYFIMPSYSKSYSTKKMDWSRPEEETFAESFALIFNILLHGFSEFHVFCKKEHKGSHAFHFQNMAPAVLWLIDNLKWHIIMPEEKRLSLKLKKVKQYFSTLPEAITDNQRRLKTNYHFIKYSPKGIKF